MDPEGIHKTFFSRVADGTLPPRRSQLSLDDVGLRPSQGVEVFRTQILSRTLDHTSRKLQARGESFYTVASAGHEGDAAIAEALRLDDVAFLHYRDAAFLIQRSKMVAGQTPTWDMLLSFAASSEDPIAGGRHKVIGSKSLNIPPQTSTIASHMPRAMGLAYGIGLAKTLEISDRPVADDSIVLCSFGDASANHSTALGAINTACWAAYQGLHMPIVFVCEDNGIGISVKTPRGWIQASFANRVALKYIKCDGLDILDTYRAAREAAAYARVERRPVFLHMTCVRLYGHAGSDVQGAYLSRGEIEEAEAGDPLLHTARTLIDLGVLGPEDVLAICDDIERSVTRVAEEAIKRPKLSSSVEVMQSLVPPKRVVTLANRPSAEERAAAFAADLSSLDKPQHLAKLINWTLTDLMLTHRNIVVAGEDVGRKGGVYGVTLRLQARFGAQRVMDTLLDEQSILGLALGLSMNGMLPIPEIQFLAYVHNAEDQIRGEAATMSFFSNGQYANGMIVRVPGLSYQKGFGGHFHNDNSLAVFRDVPGVIMACPSNGADAVGMLRECARLALEEQRVVVFVEPIALYMTRDLHADKDGLWSFKYEAQGEGSPIRLGEVGCFGDGADLAIVTYGNGYYFSRQAEKVLTENHGLDLRVIDLRWLAPLDEAGVIEAVGPCKRVLIVDECRITGSQSEALMAMFAERAPDIRVKRIAAEDSFIPIGRASTLTLPSRDSIVAAAQALAREAARA